MWNYCLIPIKHQIYSPLHFTSYKHNSKHVATPNHLIQLQKRQTSSTNLTILKFFKFSPLLSTTTKKLKALSQRSDVDDDDKPGSCGWWCRRIAVQRDQKSGDSKNTDVHDWFRWNKNTKPFPLHSNNSRLDTFQRVAWNPG